MKEKIRIAIYSRKSKYSDKGNSCGNQIELAMKYIKQHFPEDEYDVEIVIYEDEGFSGGNIDRPQFQKMLKQGREKHFDKLICYRLDRISRNIADFSNLMSELTRFHTDFISIKEQFDTSTPMGRAMMYIASVFAQLEREVIAERIRDNMIELAKTGRWLGGETPTGFNAERYELVNLYEKNNDNTLEKKKKKACKLIENKEEREVIEIIFKKYLEIKSLTGLETYLIQHNILSRRGVYFGTSRLRDVLTNPVYSTYDQNVKDYFESKGMRIFIDESRKDALGKYGLISYNKKDGERNKKDMSEWIIAVGLHPGYVTGLDWIRTQELIEKNSEKRYRANCKHEALFSGILRCGQCGSYMRPKTTGKRVNGSNQRRYYYTCEMKDRSQGAKCQGANITGITMDILVVNKLKEIFVPNSDIYKELKRLSITKEKKDNKEELQDLRKIYDKNLAEIKNLIEKLKYMDIDVVEYINEELRRLKSEKQELQDKIQKLENEDDVHKKTKTLESKGAELICDIIENCFDKFDSLDLKFKKDILRILIQDIRGNGDKIEVDILNTKIEENTKRLFSDIVKESNSKSSVGEVVKTEEELEPSANSGRLKF